MSSLRNAVKRITHKERSQPNARQKLGLLEKKGDYKQRSNDYHQKQDRLKGMREKAANRNPDEFYTAMHKAQIDSKTGKSQRTAAARREELDDTLSGDAVKIMKHQDLAYVRNERLKNATKVEKLQASLHFLNEDGGGDGMTQKRKHTVFVDSQKEAINFDVAKHFDTVPEMANRAFNRPRLSKLMEQNEAAVVESDSDDDGNNNNKSRKRRQHRKKQPNIENGDAPPKSEELLQRRHAKKLARQRAAAYKELEARKQRVASLTLAEAHLATQKAVAGKGRKRKVVDKQDGRPAVYKWDRIRAR
jgi:U3 small nucleolar RNA-associated protein 11